MKLQFSLLIILITGIVCHISDECLQIHNVSHAQLETLSPKTPIESIPRNIKCFAKCLLRDYIGNDDKLDLERVGDKASPQEKVILKSCTSKYDAISGSAPCDYGYLILQCLTLNTKPQKT